MSSVLLMLLLPVIRAQHVPPAPSCPASCVVCSGDAVICQRLAQIIAAPHSTQALLLTEGSISSVQPASLSDLNNITVIGLSNNHISELGKEAFRNLPFLHTLLLDHNLLTSQALQGGALINLTQLEVLALGHNLISMIQAGWFEGAKALLSLKLEGNLLTSLDSGSLPLNDLRKLENLDLSDNLIGYLDRNSFYGLVRLKTLDLSRNRLSSAPAEAFSYLSWLTNLNLDLNSWNCSCELLELAAVLSTFIQQPDKTLYNGRRMVCVSADNPAVTTVLDLTEANCIPSNQNITVQIQTRASVTPQLYARDLAITAVICFIACEAVCKAKFSSNVARHPGRKKDVKCAFSASGRCWAATAQGTCIMSGAGLTLFLVLICYQVSRRKKRKQSQRLKVEEERSSTVVNHVNHIDVSKRKRDFLLQANGSQSWNKETMMWDVKTDGYGAQFRSRADKNGGDSQCPHCNADGPNPMRRDNWMNGGTEAEDSRERRVMMMMDEERGRAGFQQRTLSRDVPNKIHSHGNTNLSSHPPREISRQRLETFPSHKTSRDMDNHTADMETKIRGHKTLHSESSHRTYRPPEQSVRQGGFPSNPTNSSLLDDFLFQHEHIDRKRNGHHQFDKMRNVELKRESRNVRFDSDISTSSQGKNRLEGDTVTSGDMKKGREKTHKVQSNRLVKVKLNLNPLQKSKVHPRRKTEQGHTEKGSSKKSKEKRKHRKERGEVEEKEKSGKRKSSKTGRSAKGGDKDRKETGEVERGQKSKTSDKHKKTSKSEQEGTKGDQGENSPESSQPAGSTTSADQSASAQASNTQGFQYQAVGAAPDSAQLSYQYPFSLISTERNQTPSRSLLGSAGSQLTSSNLSLQAGNVLLNTTALGSNTLLTGGPSNPITSGIAFSGPSMAPRGTTDSLSGQAGGGIVPSLSSLLGNTAHTNPLIHTAPFHTSQAEGPPLNLANPAINSAPLQPLSKSQLPPDSSALVAAPKPDLSHGQDKAGEGQLQMPTESQAPKESLSDQVQGEKSGVAPQTLEPVTTVENISNNNSQIETGLVSMLVGGMTLNEGSAAGVSGESVQAADVSVSGASAPSISTQSGSSPGPALLQQEYLSEEGGSSPRRKLRLVLPEKTSSRPPTALERKIR